MESTYHINIYIEKTWANPTINHDVPEFDVVDGGRDDEGQYPCAVFSGIA
jgi:hypothetical protein